MAGIQGSVGIIHTELVSETSYSLSVIGWIGSLMIGLCTMSCIGMNLISFSSIMILRGYFLKMLPLAYGMCLAGVGVGMVSFPPFYVYLHVTFGLQGSFLIVSAICMNSVVFSGLTVPTRTQSQKKSMEKGLSLADLFDFSLFKSYTFVMFVTGHLIFNIAYAVPFTYLPIKGEETGFSEQSSALFITVLGAGSSVGRILFGWMSGKFPLIRKKAFLVVMVLSTLSLLPVSFTSSYSLIMVCSTIFGACAGIIHTEIPSFLIGLIGIDNLPNGLSVAYLQQGIGSLVGIPIAEAVCRRVGDNSAFVFTTVVCALVLVLFTLSLYLPERKPETPKVPHILPEVPKPEVFVVTMAETGPTAA
uniref:Monocarboxylate transporter 2 n=1 Tax=Magallana gigas TaxID=29159 RepID=K1QBW7_MAGGI